MPLDDFDPGLIPGLDDHHPSIPSIITPIEESGFPHDIKLIKDEDDNPIFPVTLTDCIGHVETKLSVSELINTYNVNLVRWKQRGDDEEETSPDQYSFSLSESISLMYNTLNNEQKSIGTTINFIDEEGEYQSWEYVGGDFASIDSWRRKDSNYIRKLESVEDSVRRIELSVEPAIVESGVNTSVTLSYEFYYFDELVSDKQFIIFDSQNNQYSDSQLNSITTDVNLIDNSLTFYVSCEDSGELIQNEITVDVVRPSYIITLDGDDPDNNPESIDFLQNSREYTFENTTLENRYLIYKYPKSFGELNSIKDQNGIEYINFFNLEEDDTYYTYESKDPMTVSSDYKQIFS